MIPEHQLHEFWKTDYVKNSSLQTSCGLGIQVIHPGVYNHNQGPDFIHARLIIGNTLWIGNIEFHRRTSDWFRHRHQGDPNYTNIILHVVWEHDDVNYFSSPLLVLSHFFSSATVSCRLAKIDAQFFNHVFGNDWQKWGRMRLRRKMSLVVGDLQQTTVKKSNFFWPSLFRTFGGSVNKEAFEDVGSIFSHLHRAPYIFHLTDIESILFGQAGLLDPSFKDRYPQCLYRLYTNWSGKMGCPTIYHRMHFLRMRPLGFPTVRLAQLSFLISNHFRLDTIAYEEANQVIEELLRASSTSRYWDTHFQFDKPTYKVVKHLGNGLIQRIMINAVFPWRAWIKNTGKLEAALLDWEDFLLHYPPESNSILEWMSHHGATASNAFESQALLEMYRSVSFSN